MKRLFILIVIFFISADIPASDKNDFRDNQIKFIKNLYLNNRYFDTIAETEKLQIHEKNPGLDLFIYSNYFLAGQYNSVINNYYPGSSSFDIKFPSLLLLSGSFLKKGMYIESYKILKDYEYDNLPDKYIFTMFLRRVEPLILSGSTSLIDEEISKSGPFLEDKYDFIKLRDELQFYKKEGLKSPGYSAIMSAIVPGLGQCYSGKVMDGVISFITVAASVAGGFYLRDSGRKGFSNTLFFFSGLFYAGNIYGAYNSAETRNHELLQYRHRSFISNYGEYNPRDYVDLESVLR